MFKTIGTGLRVPFYAPEGGEGGGGGGGGGGGDGDDGGGDGGEPTLEQRIQEAVARETKGLRSKRDELISERRELKGRLDSLLDKLGGEDAIDSLVKQREKLRETELGQLLADGKYDEWFDHRVQGMREGHERALTKAQKEAEKIVQERDSAIRQYESLVLETKVREIAAKSEGFRPEAVADALLAARQAFSFDPKHGLVMKDEDDAIVYGEDPNTPLSLADWLEQQKPNRRHWWEGSQGAGANGETRGLGGRPSAPDATAIGKMSMAEYREFRKKQGIGSGSGYKLPGY